jgi:hypothetical protein
VYAVHSSPLTITKYVTRWGVFVTPVVTISYYFILLLRLCLPKYRVKSIYRKRALFFHSSTSISPVAQSMIDLGP